VVAYVGVQLGVIVWKLKLAIRKVGRAVSDNVIVAFVIKIGMFLYFSLVVSTVDRILE
jgi:hypothetical protein